MEKKRRKKSFGKNFLGLLILVAILFIFLFFVGKIGWTGFATWTYNSSSSFNNGTYNQTEYNDTIEAVTLTLNNIDQDMIAFFSSTPEESWNVLNGIDDSLNLTGQYLRGSDAQGTATGSNTHEHVSSYFDFGGAAPIWFVENYLPNPYVGNCDAGVHGFSHGHGPDNNEPPYYTVIPAVGGTTLPANTTLFYDGASVPTGWTAWSTVYDKFIKMNTTGGGTGGAASHSHSFTGNTASSIHASPSGAINWCYGQPNSHQHTADHTHPNGNNYPEWYSLIPIRNDEETIEIPIGVVAFFKGSDCPNGWSLFTEAEDKFINLKSTSGATGGANSHTHNHAGMWSGWFNVGCTGARQDYDDNFWASYNDHRHAWGGGNHENGDNILAHVPLLICKKFSTKYVSTGNYTSEIFNATIISTWNNISWESTVPSNTTLNLTVRSCNDSLCYGESFADITNTSPQDLSVANNQYFQYRFVFETTNTSSTSKLYNVTIDYTPDTSAPLINLTSPSDDAGDSDGNVTFSYNVSDDNDVTNCSLIIDNEINQTNSSVIKNVTMNITSNNLPVGIYVWSINCTDEANNVGSSEERSLSVVLSTEFSGNTTDFSDVDMNNIINLIIDQPAYGKISFNEEVNLSSGVDLDSYVEISNNRIELDSITLSDLDSKTATLYLYNLTFSNPRILKDGAVCSSTVCTKNSYSGGTLNFTVTSFSVYSAEETPVAAVISGNGGNGGGGEVIKFTISPELFEKTMILNGISFDEITITNKENSERSFNVHVESLEDIISFEETSVNISSKSMKRIEFKINAPNKSGIYTGKIIITSSYIRKEALVIINVESEKSLFDITVSIPEAMKTINLGENLKAQIDLLEMGVQKYKDVILNYMIKDFDGNIHLTESETIAVSDQKTFSKKFHTKDLLSGNYVLGVELVYPDGVAVASSHFKIRERFELGRDQIILVALIFLSLISVGMVLLIRRYKNMIKKVKRSK